MGTQISDETSRLKSFTDYMSSRFKEKRLSKKSRVDLPPPTSGEYADYRFLSHFLGVDKLQQKWEARQEKLARRKKIKEALPAIIGGTIAIIAGLALIAGAIFGITLAVKSAAESQERARAEASQSAQATPSPTKTTSSPTPSPTPSKNPSSSPSPSKSSSDSSNNDGKRSNPIKSLILMVIGLFSLVVMVPAMHRAVQAGDMKSALVVMCVILLLGTALVAAVNFLIPDGPILSDSRSSMIENAAVGVLEGN